MKSLNSPNNFELIANKVLGKKIKRFKNSLKPNIRDQKKPPTLSQSTLIQIEKVINNKKNKCQKTIKTPDDSNFSTSNDSSNFKLPELSLKEQYQDLLNRKELILPPKYRLLLKKQNYLDDILSENNNMDSNIKENINHAYKNIQNNFNIKMHMNFCNNDFQQILFVCPFYYIYQSINKVTKGIEIKYIDIPHDYIQRMNKKYNLKTNFTLMQTPKQYEPIKGEINKAVMEKRKILFKKN